METTNLPPMPDPSAQQTSSGGSGQGHKKALLQKLISNLLDKPGRSMHEIINGVKEAISAYRNYAKEWDTLNGVATGAAIGGAVGGLPGAVTGAAVGCAAKNSIQTILDQIKQQKSSIPNQPPMPTSLPQMPPSPATMPMPTSLPPMPQKAMPPQGMPPNGMGGPGDMVRFPSRQFNSRPSPMGNPNGMPIQARGTPALGNRPRFNVPMLEKTQPIGGSIIPSLGLITRSDTTQPDYHYDKLIAGQPQTSTFNRPAPVSNLGVYGF